MDKKLLKDYARLLALSGVRVEKGDEVWIQAQVDQVEFVKMCVEECYKAGARKVVVRYYSDELIKLNYKYMRLSDLSRLEGYELARYKYMAKKIPSMLHIISEDPDVFAGVNPTKIARSQMKIRSKTKPYRNAVDGKQKWCIGAVPSIKWAKKFSLP